MLQIARDQLRDESKRTVEVRRFRRHRRGTRARFTAAMCAAALASLAVVRCAAPPMFASQPTFEAPQMTARAASPPSDQAPPATAESNRAAWDRLAALDGASCREKLKTLDVRFRSLPDSLAPNAEGCGIPHGVLVSEGPTGIKYSPPLQLDCSLALELPAIERAIQQAAQRELESPIAAVTTFGTYSCRNKRGGVSGNLSEHAVGDAIDIGAFAMRRGRPITVARDYRPLDSAPDARGRFLRAVFQQLQSEPALTHVIGPETRADHHDHIHVDRGPSWWRSLLRPE